jgi:biotin carboxyl carrier protein
VPEAKRDGREPQGRKPARGETDGRLADHAEIGRLTDALLPALIAKLATTRLGELEVREGEWRVRLRRPASPEVNYGRRVTDKPSRSQPGHEGHAHARGSPESPTARATRLTGVGPGGPADGAPAAPTNGTGAVRATLAAARLAERDRNVAYSPAVGVFHPGARAVAGTRVRSGDALGSVDVLGVPQEVLAPADGIVATTLVEGGTAVEYGQELVRLELTTPAEAR